MHTFVLINREGKETLVKFHWKPTCGEHAAPSTKIKGMTEGNTLRHCHGRLRWLMCLSASAAQSLTGYCCLSFPRLLLEDEAGSAPQVQPLAYLTDTSCFHSCTPLLQE